MSHVWGRIVRRFAVVVSASLVIGVATQQAPPQLLSAPAHVNWSDLTSWADDAAHAVFPSSAPGSAAGHGHTAASAATRAGHGKGTKPGNGAGALPAFAAKSDKVAPGVSGHVYSGYNAKTSRFDAGRSTAQITAYDNADGTVTKRVSASPVNFKNSRGRWQPIDTTLAGTASGRWQDGANGFTTSFGPGAKPGASSVTGHSPATSRSSTPGAGAGAVAPSAADALAQLSLASNESFAWSLQGAASVRPSISSDTATYPNILPDTTLIMSDEAWGVRELLRLSSASAGNSWTFPLSMTGVTLDHAADGTWDLVDGSGAVVGTLDAPWAMDSNYNRVTGMGAQTKDVSYSLSTVGGVEELTMTLSKSWLDASSRVFPVTVDPTVTVTDGEGVGSETSSFVDTEYCTVNCVANDSSNYLSVGNNDGTGDEARAFVDFPSADVVDQGAHVVSAQLAAFMFWTGTSTDLDSNSTGGSSLEVGPLTSAIPTSGTLLWPGPSINTSSGDAIWNSDDGWSSASACSDITSAGYETNENRWVYDDISDVSWLDAWQQGTSAYYGFGMAGVNDLDGSLTSGNSWKQFASATDSACAPYLSITEDVEQDPQVTSMTPAANTLESTLTPTFAATATSADPWNPTLKFDFTVYSGSTGSEVVDSGWVSASESGSVWSAKWSVPSGKLSWNQTFTWRVMAYDGYGFGQGDSSVSYYPFSTVSPPPLLTTGLSQNTGGHGFDAALGNYTSSATDASVAGYGPALEIDRDYNSLDPRTSQALGAGWSSILDSRVAQVEDGTGNVLEAVFTYPDGSQAPYGLDADGDYAPPQGTFGSVTYSSSTGYKLIDQNDTVYLFGKNITPSGQSSQVWGLTSITNAQGQTLTLVYNTSGQVSELTGASGRHLTVTWQSALGTGASYEHVSSIATDPVTAGGSNPLTWSYSYTGDQLSSVCNPDQHCDGYTYQAGSEYQNAVINSAANSYWPLDEAAGAATASSAVLVNEQADAGKYTNVTTGAAATSSTSSPLAGSTATVAQFNGSSSQVQTSQKSIVSATGDFTVSGWAEVTSASGNQDVVTEDGAYNSAFYLQLYGGKWSFSRIATDSSAGSTGTRALDATAATAGTWYFLAGTYDPGSGLMTLYVNGSQVATATDSTPFAGTGALAIGRGFFAGAQTDWFGGDISDVAVWNQDLSGIQIANLYSIGKHATAMLTSLTNPAEAGSGTATEKASYNTVTGRVTDVWDGGGEYQVSAPAVTGSSQVFASAVLGSGAAYYYRLNEGAGATSALNQVNTGAATYNAVTLGGAGEFPDATSAAFNGSSSYVQLPSGILNSHFDVSVGFWFKTTATSQVLFSHSAAPLSAGSTTSNFQPWVYVGKDGKLVASVGASDVTESGSAVNNGAWHYALFMVTNTTQTLYLDGAVVGTGTPHTDSVAENEIYVGTGFIGMGWPDEANSGSSSATPAYFDGSISDVAVWRDTVADQTANSIYTSAKNSKGIVPVESVTVTDPQSDTSVYRYDPLNGDREVSETDGRGYTTTYGYDTNGFPQTVTDPNGDVTTTEHDVRGNLVAKTTCQDMATDACSTAYWTYSPDDTSAILTASPENNAVLTSRAPDSSSSTDPTYETTYGYDNLGDQTTVTSPPVTTESFAGGSYTASSSQAGLTTTKTYEGEISGSTTIKQLAYGSTTVDVPTGLLLTSATPGGGVTRYSYFTDGDLAQVTTPTGETTTYSYDNLGRVASKTLGWSATYSGTTTAASATTSYTYNGEGQVATETDPLTTDAVTGATHQKLTTNTYDTDGNLTKQVVSDLGTGADASRTTSWQYTPYDQVASETDPDTDTTSYTYYASGLKETEKDPEGNLVEYDYDADGNLTSTILENYDGSNSDATTAGPLTVESRAYDPADRLASVTNGTGVQTVYTYYDDNQQATVSTVSADGTASYTDEQDYYDGSGNLTAKTTGNGAITTDYTVDADDRVIESKVDPTGADQVTTTTYFADSTPATSTTTADGTTRENEYTYDAGDNVLTDTLVADGVNRVSTDTRDTRGLVETAQNPAGNVTTYLYDVLGQRTAVEQPAISATTFNANALTATTATALPTTTTGYNTFGQPAETEDPNGNVTAYHFDADGNPTQIVGASYTPLDTSTALTPTEKRTYTADGQLYQDTDPDGNVTTYGYDQFGDQISVKDPDTGTSTASYNSAGQMTKQVTAAGTTTGTAYDNLGRVASTSIYESATGSTNTTADAYDWAGRLEQTTSPLGVTQKYGFDDLGETTSSTDGAGNTTNYVYDGFGDIAKTTYANGTYTDATYNALSEPTASTTYNSAGAKLTSSSEAYNLDGVETSATNPLDVVETFTPNADGSIVSETQPVTSSTSITTSIGYDLDGNETAYTDGNGNTTYWTYNSLNQQNTKTVPATSSYSGAGDQNTDYAYDADGRLTYEQEPGSVAQSFTYDADGDVTQEYGYIDGTNAPNATRSYTYDGDGDMTSAVTCADPSCASVLTAEGFSWNNEGEVTGTSGAAGSSTFAYNDDGQMASRTDASGTTNYLYNSAGQMAGVNGPSGWTNSTYTYNDMDQVASITYDGTGDVQSYGYSALDQLTSDTLATSGGAQVAAIDYGYDAAGEETSQDTYGIGTTSGTTDVANAYQYNEAGELTAWNDGSSTTSYGYDDDGNRTCVTTSSAGCTAANSTYTYDARDELTADGSNTYTYGADGDLASKTIDGGGTTDYTYDALGQMTADGALTYSYDGLGRVVESGTTALTYSGTGNNVSSDGTATYELDPSGAVIADQTTDGPISQTMTDTHDNLVAEFGSTATSLTAWQTYDPLGNVVGGSGWSAAVGYQSGYTSNGQVNMDSRWYSPSSGQFDSADTAQNSALPNPLSANPYAYGNGSPLDGTDPTGHSASSCVEQYYDDPAGLAGCLAWNSFWNTDSTSSGDECQTDPDGQCDPTWMCQQGYWTCYGQGGSTNPCGYGEYSPVAPCEPSTAPPSGNTGPPTNSSPGGGQGDGNQNESHRTTPSKPVCDAACQALKWLHTLEHDSTEGKTHDSSGHGWTWLAPLATAIGTAGPILAAVPDIAAAADCLVDPEACTQDPGDDPDQDHCDTGGGGAVAAADVDADEGESCDDSQADTCLDARPAGSYDAATSGGGWVLNVAGPGGRAEAGVACLFGDPSRSDSRTPNGDPVGWSEAQATAQKYWGTPLPDGLLARCHLIANEFGGSGDVSNLAPCFQRFVNVNAGGITENSMRDFEAEVGDYLDSGDVVSYVVQAHYKTGASTVPDYFNLYMLATNSSGAYINSKSLNVINAAISPSGTYVDLGN